MHVHVHIGKHEAVGQSAAPSWLRVGIETRAHLHFLVSASNDQNVGAVTEPSIARGSHVEGCFPVGVPPCVLDAWACRRPRLRPAFFFLGKSLAQQRPHSYASRCAHAFTHACSHTYQNVVLAQRHACALGAPLRSRPRQSSFTTHPHFCAHVRTHVYKRICTHTHDALVTAG